MAWVMRRDWPYPNTDAYRWVPPLDRPLAIPPEVGEDLGHEDRCKVCGVWPDKVVAKRDPSLVRWMPFHAARAHLPRRVEEDVAVAKPVVRRTAQRVDGETVAEAFGGLNLSLGQRLGDALTRRPYNPED